MANAKTRSRVVRLAPLAAATVLGCAPQEDVELNDPGADQLAIVAGAGFATIAALVDEADAALATNGFTPEGSPVRAYQEQLKTALDRANNNLNFVQGGPASCPAPAF